MKVIFDASDLCTNRADGTTRYTKELLQRLTTLDQSISWHVAAPCAQPAGGAYKNISWHASPWPKYWTQLRLPFDLMKINPDLLFMPIQQLPIVRPRCMRTVCVVHDLAFLIFPKQFTRKDRLLLRYFTARAVAQADRIIAVSQATADDIRKFYGRSEGVRVVHHGVDHQAFYQPTEEERTQGLHKIGEWNNRIRSPYILFVGQIQPRKNLANLIAAFEELRQTNKQLQLVIAGGHGWLQQPIFDRAKTSPAANDIIFTGRVPDHLLPALYWNAQALALVSLYEGFGMTVLEAMACGCPVVTSNVSSMPEFAGGCSVLVNPHDVKSIVSGLNKAMADRNNLSAAGIKQAKQFTWKNTAADTLRVIKELL